MREKACERLCSRANGRSSSDRESNVQTGGIWLVSPWQLLGKQTVCRAGPNPFVGSITHTKQFAWAVVGFQADLLGIGVDCEQIVSRRTSLDISELVATRDELDLIQSKFDFETSLTLCFSAKEAVYKTINPITNWPIDFRDLSVNTFNDSSLRIQLKPNRFDFATAIGFDVGFEFADDHVFSWSLFPHSPISVDLTRHISSRQFHSIKNRSTVASI